MPQKIICSECGEIFYEGTELKPPEEIMQRLKGICPTCGKSLNFDPKKVDIQASKLNGKNIR